MSPRQPPFRAYFNTGTITKLKGYLYVYCIQRRVTSHNDTFFFWVQRNSWQRLLRCSLRKSPAEGVGGGGYSDIEDVTVKRRGRGRGRGRGIGRDDSIKLLQGAPILCTSLFPLSNTPVPPVDFITGREEEVSCDIP